jgi:hypothetical protein
LRRKCTDSENVRAATERRVFVIGLRRLLETSPGPEEGAGFSRPHATPTTLPGRRTFDLWFE